MYRIYNINCSIHILYHGGQERYHDFLYHDGKNIVF